MKRERCFEIFDNLEREMSKVIIGQKELIESLIIGLIAPVPYTPKDEHRTGCGHILMDARPGTGKTIAAEVFGAIIEGADFKRIQFTSDTMPSDIGGFAIYLKDIVDPIIKRGPVFANIVLADEINRGTPRSKSGLLEPMQERKVTIVGQEKSFVVPFPFFVIATQNPVEQEGVYINVEAEKDRFMFKIALPRLSAKERAKITGQDFGGLELNKVTNINEAAEISKIIREEVFPGSELLARIRRDEEEPTKVQNHIVSIFEATDPKTSQVKMLLRRIEDGTSDSEARHEEVFIRDYLRADIRSDRCGQHFLAAAKAHAFYRGHRKYVAPYDIKKVAHRVMRDRLMLNNKALAYAMKNQELNIDMADRIISAIINTVPIP